MRRAVIAFALFSLLTASGALATLAVACGAVPCCAIYGEATLAMPSCCTPQSCVSAPRPAPSATAKSTPFAPPADRMIPAASSRGILLTADAAPNFTLQPTFSRSPHDHLTALAVLLI